MYKADIFNNNNKIDAAGPQSPTNTVSLIQCTFSSDHLLGTTQLVLNPGFSIYRPMKWHSHLNRFGSWNCLRISTSFIAPLLSGF